ncbi:molybdate transport system substrate-binding protein [Actinoalloteichus hoggarensis]|uniref:Molybdate-binding periplasmic protein n=1 Tax=Actinoalloteichus hoggarensis TaxID=1470176 RepID=A0A221W057_9PSEU|nr:molybdate ABC transporter substrate-binding protein [Actinoalloteichus hoggarensis]ASO19146.1 Molybdate-binding periplasmic protein precursor [Actinoalloteichus hoggarensis]MBB5920382.1 molybdate transport system substrate-binding protein [Actinoalloteichus hoggarensis]
MTRALFGLALGLCVLGSAGCGAVPGSVDGAAADRSSSGSPADGVPARQLTVFAAASLTEGFTELARRFEEANPGVSVRSSFAGSGTLVQQLEHGAPADVLATADVVTMDRAVEAGLTGTEPVVFATNRLQIAVPPDDPANVTRLADLAAPGNTIALCAVEVPCGAAAEEAFDRAGFEPAPDTREQDVKAVLTKVVLGEADAGLVYRTDVHSAGETVRGIDFTEADEVVNDYPIAVVADSPQARLAREFLDFARSETGHEVLADLGFGPP